MMVDSSYAIVELVILSQFFFDEGLKYLLESSAKESDPNITNESI